MAKISNEFKLKIVEERIINKKTFIEIEREHGVLRGTAFSWVKRYKAGTLFQDGRGGGEKESYDDYEFLKKSLALLKEIRSK